MKLNNVGKIKGKDWLAVVMLSGIENGKEKFYYLALHMDKYVKLREALELGGTVDLKDATILKEGYGEPSTKLYDEIVTNYKIQSMYPQQIEENLAPFLSDSKVA